MPTVLLTIALVRSLPVQATDSEHSVVASEQERLEEAGLALVRTYHEFVTDNWRAGIGVQGLVGLAHELRAALERSGYPPSKLAAALLNTPMGNLQDLLASHAATYQAGAGKATSQEPAFQRWLRQYSQSRVARLPVVSAAPLFPSIDFEIADQRQDAERGIRIVGRFRLDPEATEWRDDSYAMTLSSLELHTLALGASPSLLVHAPTVLNINPRKRADLEASFRGPPALTLQLKYADHEPIYLAVDSPQPLQFFTLRTMPGNKTVAARLLSRSAMRRYPKPVD